MPLRPSPALYTTVFFVSLALLAAQVAVTRLLAYRLFYHFVFFVISLSQLGLAAAGAYVHAFVRGDVRTPFVVRWLERMALLCLLTLAVYAWLSPLPDERLKVTGARAVPYLLAISLPLVGMNFAGGVVLTVAFSRFRERITSLYGADLLGAALGCVLSVWVMRVGTPLRAFLLAGVLALGCAAWLDREARAEGEAAPPAPGPPDEPAPPPSGASGPFRVGLALVFGAALAWPWIFDPNLLYRIDTLLIRTRWDHLARADAVAPAKYMVDGGPGTDIAMSRHGSGGDASILLEYHLAPAKPKVAIIGVGAGPQLAEALDAGASRVVAIDINEAFIDWSKGEDAEANGRIFLDPRVEAYADEGRHFIQSRTEVFDVIKMFGIDTYTASASGAYSMTENFLYTVEAFDDYLEKLSPRGVMVVTRWYFDPPRENLRLFSTILEALRRDGRASPSAHVMVLAARNPDAPGKPFPAYTLFSPSPYDAQQVRAAEEVVERLGWEFLHHPTRDLGTPFTRLAKAPSRQAFQASYPYVVEPATDARPFFFQLLSLTSTSDFGERWTQMVHQESTLVLTVSLTTAFVLTVLLLGGPLLVRRRELSGVSGLATSGVYFSCLGVGFMAFELPVIQIASLFLGHPTYALSVVVMGLLAAAGTGSLLAARLPRKAVRPVLLSIVVLAGLSAFGLLRAVHALLDLSFPAKLAITLAYLTLIGLPLGTPFACGVREIEDEGPDKVAWSWAANGAASVLGSCGMMVVLVHFGSSAALLLAGGCYAVAAAAFGALGRGQPSE